MSNSSSKGTALVTGASRGIEILLLKERLNPSCIQQKSRDLNLWQACHEIAEKSSIIVPLGAPLLLNVCAAFVSFTVLMRLPKKTQAHFWYTRGSGRQGTN